MEWTHWKNASGTALRGAEWYLFDPDSLRIAEIRAYYAAPADRSVAGQRAGRLRLRRPRLPARERA